ncbi:hypothetical protein WJX77_005250 [Trebouxia sp. C0004]
MFRPMHADTEVADLDLWASDTDNTPTRIRSTEKRPERANLRVLGRLHGLQQVFDPGMAAAIQPHPARISRGTQTVRDTKKIPSITARQALATQSHQHRHNRSAVTSHNQLQPDSKAAHMSKGSAVSILGTGAHQAARNSEKPGSQNSHPNLPTSCRRLQLQMEQQHKLKLADLHVEKEAQVQHCQELKKDLQQQLLYIQQVITQLNDKEACLEAKYHDVVQELTAPHVAFNPSARRT